MLDAQGNPCFLSHISQIVAKRFGWWDFIRDAAMIFFPNDPNPWWNHHGQWLWDCSSVQEVIPPHNSCIRSAPLRHWRYKSKNSDGRQVMKEYLPIWSLEKEISFKKHNDKYLGGSGHSSLPHDILWVMPHEGFGAALKYPLLGECETANHSTLVGKFSCVTPLSHPNCWNCRIAFSCFLKTVWC